MNVRSHVGLCSAVFLPLLVQRFTLFADDIHGCEKLLHLETCCEDDHVEVSLLSAATDDTGFGNLADTFWYNFDVGRIQCVQIIWIEDSSLTACLV